MVTQKTKPSLAWILLCLSAVTVACSGPATGTLTHRTSEQTETPGPVTTDTGLPALTVAPSGGGAELEDWPQELYVSMGGGDGVFCAPPPDAHVPGMRVQMYFGSHGYLCLWGFTEGEVIHLSLYEPGGRLVAAKEMAAGSDHRLASDTAQVELWFPGLQTGEWRAEATSSQARLECQFRVSDPDSPITFVMPGSAVDIFSGERWLCGSENVYGPDDQLVIFGAGLPPQQQFPCGIFRDVDHPLYDPVNLVFERMVTTDDQGHFWLIVPGDASWSTGRYFAVVLPQVGYNQWTGEYEASASSSVGCFVIADE